MKRLLNKHLTRLLVFLFFYLFVFFYTVSFNKEAGWVLFFFLTFLLLIDVLSFLPSTKKIHVETLEQSRMVVNKKNRLKLTFFRYRPTLVPIPLVSIYLASTKEQCASLPLYTGKKKMIEIDFTPSQRGIFETLSLTMKSFDLLDFFSKTSFYQVKGPFMVLPEYKHELALELKKQLVLSSTSFRNTLGQPTTMIRTFRTYQPGDALKVIDWKQSSKKGELIVKEYEHETENTFRLVFYGVVHEQFETILAIYYSFSHVLSTQTKFKETILADKQEQQDRDSLFASMRPIEPRLLPTFPTGEKLLIFAPELTEPLTTQLLELANRNEVSVIAFKEKQLFLFSQDQVLLIGEEGDKHA
ncbi:DUF58 domain-containing protein [Enterococcus sp. LJL99]